jgi:predicted DNA-binding protein
MSTLTIRLDPKLEKELDRIARQTGRTKSEIAREALQRQVAVTRFRELRRRSTGRPRRGVRRKDGPPLHDCREQGRATSLGAAAFVNPLSAIGSTRMCYVL